MKSIEYPGLLPCIYFLRVFSVESYFEHVVSKGFRQILVSYKRINRIDGITKQALHIFIILEIILICFSHSISLS